jgi:hypothetical protein
MSVLHLGKDRMRSLRVEIHVTKSVIFKLTWARQDEQVNIKAVEQKKNCYNTRVSSDWDNVLGRCNTGECLFTSNTK